jgi:hypothetical protein
MREKLREPICRYEYDSEGRVSRLWTLDEFDVNEPAAGIKIYEYETDEVGTWVERRESYQSRVDSDWSTGLLPAS